MKKWLTIREFAKKNHMTIAQVYYYLKYDGPRRIPASAVAYTIIEKPIILFKDGGEWIDYKEYMKRTGLSKNGVYLRRKSGRVETKWGIRKVKIKVLKSDLKLQKKYELQEN